jgi:hypothetical protein
VEGIKTISNSGIEERVGNESGCMVFYQLILRLLILLSVPLLTIPITPLVFVNGGFGGVLTGVILWGAVLGIQETIMKAAISDMIPIARRGLVFGIFNTAYGISWFLGGVNGHIVWNFYFIFFFFSLS